MVLLSHPVFLSHPMVHKHLTPCVLNCLSSFLFFQHAQQFLRQNVTTDKIEIRSIFLLFTCLDYCTVSSVTSGTLQLLPSICQILAIWCEVAQRANDDTSPLIVRLIRLIHQLALFDSDVIIRENLCCYLLPHFQILCQTATLIDELVPILLILCSTTAGKQHLRQLECLQAILPETKRHIHLWHPVSLLITTNDFFQPSLFKRLIHLLIQRTINVFQSLATASNDTSFDSTTPSTKNQMALGAIEWFDLLRTNFLSFTMIVEEFIASTKKNNFLNMFIDTILALEQEDEILPKLIDVLIELLWTLSLSISTQIHDHLQKRVDLCRWLTMNITDATPTIRLASQAILSTLEQKSKTAGKWLVSKIPESMRFEFSSRYTDPSIIDQPQCPDLYVQRRWILLTLVSNTSWAPPHRATVFCRAGHHSCLSIHWFFASSDQSFVCLSLLCHQTNEIR